MDSKDIDMDNLDTWLRVFAEWVYRSPSVKVVYAALHRTRSVTPPTPYIGLVYQAEGAYEYMCYAGKRVCFPQGYFGLGNSHHGAYSSEPIGNVGLWAVTLDVGDAPEFQELVCTSQLLIAPVHQPEKLVSCFETAVASVHDRSSCRMLRVKASILELLATAIQEVEFLRGVGRSSLVVEMAEQYMQRHYRDSHLDLSGIAHAAHISERQLDRLFQQERKLSPMTVLRSIRLRQACMLLEATAMRIGDVAREVGFEDPLHFSRVFKNALGESPKVYRARTQRFAAFENTTAQTRSSPKEADLKSRHGGSA